MPEHDRGIWLVWLRSKDGRECSTIQFDGDLGVFGRPAASEDKVIHTRRIQLHEMQTLPPGQGTLAERLGRRFPLPPPDQRTP